MNFKKVFIGTVALILVSTLSFAQNDLDLPFSFEPSEIVEEWDDWFNNPTEENKFVADFMKKHSVPQKGQNHLNRKETWYNWISHNPAKVEEYIKLRDAE